MDFKQVKRAFEDAGFATDIYNDSKLGNCLSVQTSNPGKALMTVLDRYAEHKRQIFTGSDDVVGCLHELIQTLIEYRVKGDVLPSIIYFPHVQPPL